MSYYALFANGEPWCCSRSAPTAYYAARVYLTNPAIRHRGRRRRAGHARLVISRAVADGHPRGPRRHQPRADAGPLQPRDRDAVGLRRPLRGEGAPLRPPRPRSRRSCDEAARRGAHRPTPTAISGASSSIAARTAARRRSTPTAGVPSRSRLDARRELAHLLRLSSSSTANGARAPAAAATTAHTRDTVSTSSSASGWPARPATSANEDVYRLYRQSVEDMGALRLYEHDVGADVWLPAAGVPWFVALFGRDSLIVSLQNMLVNPGFARGALADAGADYQATEMDDWRDAEPGKILHELPGRRAGALQADPAHAVLRHRRRDAPLPDRPARGVEVARRRRASCATTATSPCAASSGSTATATSTATASRSTGPARRRATRTWAGRTPATPSSIRTAARCKQPKALCELQGYVFDAWMRMAEVFDALGEPERAAELRREGRGAAGALRGGVLVRGHRLLRLRLDPDKQPVRTIASNAGHCLWSGIAQPGARRPGRAAAPAAGHVERLGHPHALGAQPRLQPLLLSAGLGVAARQRHHRPRLQALRLRGRGGARRPRHLARRRATSSSYRLPELYAGISGSPDGFPVQYLGANVPQAWAAGSRLPPAPGDPRPPGRRAATGGSTSIPSCRAGCPTDAARPAGRPGAARPALPARGRADPLGRVASGGRRRGPAGAWGPWPMEQRLGVERSPSSSPEPAEAPAQ